MLPLQDVETPPSIGTVQPELTEGSLRAGQVETRSKHVPEQCISRRMQATSPVIQIIWTIFGRAEVDLLNSEDNSHCPTYFSKERNALAHNWPITRLYVFPLIALLPQVIRRVREVGCSVLLMAPFWRNQTLFPELIQPIPLRKNLFSQMRGMIWHPWPELRSLYVWPHSSRGWPLSMGLMAIKSSSNQDTAT